jgi:hypothetical protein
MSDLTKKLLAVLRNDHGPDHWSGTVLPTEAAPLARSLLEADWQELAAMVPGQSPAWCSRLADVSMSARDRGAFPALVAMLRRREPEVGIPAAQALLTVGYDWTPAESLLADIDRHIASDPGNSAPLHRLRGRLPA